MVRGRGIAVTAVALMYQCALITRMARGRGTARPKARHAAVYRLTSKAFIGFPWPMNAAGMISAAASGVRDLSASWFIGWTASPVSCDCRRCRGAGFRFAHSEAGHPSMTTVVRGPAPLVPLSHRVLIATFPRPRPSMR
jgi:hypothetical protein